MLVYFCLAAFFHRGPSVVQRCDDTLQVNINQGRRITNTNHNQLGFPHFDNAIKDILVSVSPEAHVGRRKAGHTLISLEVVIRLFNPDVLGSFKYRYRLLRSMIWSMVWNRCFFFFFFSLRLKSLRTRISLVTAVDKAKNVTHWRFGFELTLITKGAAPKTTASLDISNVSPSPVGHGF